MVLFLGRVVELDLQEEDQTEHGVIRHACLNSWTSMWRVVNVILAESRGRPLSHAHDFLS